MLRDHVEVGYIVVDLEMKLRDLFVEFEEQKMETPYHIPPREVFIQSEVTVKLQRQHLNGHFAVGYKSK